jgi:phosphatidylglycerol:prolipoprotein diacylglycerol transferase
VHPIPVVFHLGPLTFHTYGVGLALTALLALWWADRRLTRHAISAPHFSRDVSLLFLWALLGARIAHVATNWSAYSHRPTELVAVWHGGLSSYGGLALAIPLALWSAHSWWPNATRRQVADVLSPVIVGSWGVGRLLGPQLMVGGGGHVTHAWWGLHYAGQIGARVPVPLIQGVEDLLLAWLLTRLASRQLPPGFLAAVAMASWGLCRAVDELWLLGGGRNLGSLLVIVMSLALVLGGALLLVTSQRRAKLSA